MYYIKRNELNQSHRRPVHYVSELGDAPGDMDAEELSVSSRSLLKPPPVPEEEERAVADAPSRSRFFCFMRLFWNQIFTCVSLSSSVAAISTRRARVRYLLKWNSFSSSVSCRVLKLVRMALLWAPARPKSDTLTGWREGGERLLWMCLWTYSVYTTDK